MERLLIVPAAGPGSRLRQPIPKLLVEVNGRTMLDHLLDLYAPHVERMVFVVHPSAVDVVREHLENAARPAEAVVQPTASGMLDAILLARGTVERAQPRRVWITWCDQIAIHPRTLRHLRAASDGSAEPPLIMPTCRTADPYVHLQRDDEGRITQVLHRREEDPMPTIGESDSGLFDLSRQAFLEWLPQYAAGAERASRTGERNFLPFVAWVAARSEVVTFPCHEPQEAIGVNTPEELAIIEAHLRTRS
jgi:bifunctional UDP-N-acetylglucosamine pyrophosphorylase/glucosamine-1-phosphate N-acetyltransferase